MVYGASATRSKECSRKGGQGWGEASWETDGHPGWYAQDTADGARPSRELAATQISSSVLSFSPPPVKLLDM
jgi:hypothetical protein